MKKIAKLMAACLIVVLMFSAIGCDKGGGEVSVAFDKTKLSMLDGEKTTVSVTVTGASGQVEFASSNKNVATVAAKTETSAEITAVKAGTAKISATLAGQKAELSLTVVTPSLKSEIWSVSAAPGKSDTFKVELKGLSEGSVAQVSSSSAKIMASLSDQTGTEAVVSFKAESTAVPGDRAEITVSADGKSTSVDAIVCSEGIYYGNGTINAEAFISGENGLLALGVDNNFPGGALVFPDCAKYQGNWYQVSHIGTQNEAFKVPAGVEITSLNTGDSALTIQHETFRGMNSIHSLHIGASVLGIGDNAFNMAGHYDVDTADNGALTFDGTIDELTFAEDCSITTIGGSAFLGNKLTNLILPDTVSTIASRAFWQAGTVVLKLPSAWVAPDNFDLQFFDNVNLTTIYMPWQCLFSVTGDHYPSDTDPDDVALKTEAGLIRSIFVRKTIVNNYFTKPLTIYYSGKQELLDNLISVRGTVSGLIDSWCLENYLTPGEKLTIVYETPYSPAEA